MRAMRLLRRTKFLTNSLASLVGAATTKHDAKLKEFAETKVSETMDVVGRAVPTKAVDAYSLLLSSRWARRTAGQWHAVKDPIVTWCGFVHGARPDIEESCDPDITKLCGLCRRAHASALRDVRGRGGV